MSDITDWIYEFAQEHINRFNGWKTGWPRVKGADGKPTLDAIAFFAPWAGMLTERGVDFDTARMASAEMSTKEQQLHPGKHLDEFMKYVEKVWGRKAAEDRTGSAPQTRENAQAASANCPECAGGGYTVRPFFHKPHDREYNMTMFCLCLYGEWLAANFTARGEGADAAIRDMKKRTRRLAQYPELWDRSHRRWPTCWPLNPIMRDWPIESGWNQESYRDSGATIAEEPTIVQDLRLKVTGQGPRRLLE